MLLFPLSRPQAAVMFQPNHVTKHLARHKPPHKYCLLYLAYCILHFYVAGVVALNPLGINSNLIFVHLKEKPP